MPDHELARSVVVLLLLCHIVVLVEEIVEMFGIWTRPQSSWWIAVIKFKGKVKYYVFTLLLSGVT